MRVDRTFGFDSKNHSFTGLVTGKSALVITPSAGNFVSNTPLGHLNFCETYVRSVLGFIGIQDVTTVAVPNQFIPDERQQQIESAQAKLMELAVGW